MNNEKVNKEVEVDFMISTLMISLVEVMVSMEEEAVDRAATNSKFTPICLKIRTLRTSIYKPSSSSIEERKFGLFCTMTYLKKKVRI